MNTGQPRHIYGRPAGDATSEMLRRLIDESRAQSKAKPQQSLQSAQQALELAQSYSEPWWLAWSWTAMGRACCALGEYDEALSWYAKATDYFDQAGDDEYLGFACGELSRLYIFADRLPASLIAGRQAIDAIDRAMYSVRRRTTEEAPPNEGPGFSNLPVPLRLTAAYVYHSVGGTYLYLGDFEQAQAHYLQALRFCEDLDDRQAGNIYGDIAQIHEISGDLDTANEYARRGLAICRAYGNTFDEAVILAGIGHRLFKSAQKQKSQAGLAEAEKTAQSALAKFKEVGARFFAAITIQELAEMKVEARQWPEALDLLNEIASIGRHEQNINWQSMAFVSKARIWRELDKLDEAQTCLEQAAALVGPTTPKEQMMQLREEQYLFYLAAADYKQALECYVEFARLQNEMTGEEKQRAIAELQIRFDVEKAARERELALKETEVLRLKSVQLEESLEQKTKRVTLTGMHLAQKNELLLKLRDEVNQALQQPQRLSEFMRRIKQQIDEGVSAERTWEVFNTEFEILHHGFIHKLSQRYPNLTGLDLKVCAMIKINMRTKDIARLLCVSDRSASTYRYRIRKKMGLDPQANLVSLLASI